MKRCAKCGRRVTENAKSCVHCGGGEFDKKGLKDGLPTDFVPKQKMQETVVISKFSFKKRK